MTDEEHHIFDINPAPWQPTTIVYRSPLNGREHTLPIGRDINVDREGACLDICLERAVAIDCPLVVRILIRTSGEIVFWSSSWEPGNTNTYWHFGAGSDDLAKKRRPTDGQLEALELMFLNQSQLPGSLSSALGRPVAAWVFEGQTADQIADKHGAPHPFLA